MYFFGKKTKKNEFRNGEKKSPGDFFFFGKGLLLSKVSSLFLEAHYKPHFQNAK